MLKTTRILHACYVFESQGTRILIDPLFEDPFSVCCHAFPPVSFDLKAVAREKYDAVFISHYHDDHCSFESLNLLDRAIPIYMFCVHDEMFELLRELGFQNVYSLEHRKPIKVGCIEVTAWPALDRDVDCLLQITASETQVLNVVDSWIDYDTVEALAQISWDLILWPFQTMLEMDVLSPSRARPASRELPPEWIEQLRTLSPLAVVPSSCQFQFREGVWQNKRYFPISYVQFEREVRAALPDVQVLRLDPGSSRSSGSLDYVYDFESPVPTLKAEVDRDRNLAADDRTRADMKHFIEHELSGCISKLARLDDEPFFAQPRHWQLRVYETDQAPLEYDFLIFESHCTRLVGHQNPQWLTEIPLVKLAAALDEGESLTSLMVRINDSEFSMETERELRDVDFLIDPLLRVLFDNKFASYQKAQLRRIKQRS